MRRLVGILALALLAGGGFLFGKSVIKPSFRADAEAAAGGTVYEETGPCPGCPINLTSAEVQQRKGSTLFGFAGRWPSQPDGIGGSLRLEANGTPITLLSTTRGFEIVEGDVTPQQIAVGLRPDALWLNIEAGVLEMPVTFVFGIWDGDSFRSRIPREGALEWSGAGAPRRVAGDEPVAEAETPETFLQALATAFREGDEKFLLQRLHPAVLSLYGEATCAQYAAGLQDPTRAFEILSVGDPAPYDYIADGHTVEVPDAHSVQVNATSQRADAKIEVHVAPGADGALSWFTDCGEPRPLP